MRRFTLSKRAGIAALIGVVTIPLLIGLGASTVSPVEFETLRQSNESLRFENESYRAATGELADQIASLQGALTQLGDQARLDPGARVVFMDNRYVEGSSTPVTRRDAEGNGYQTRRLGDGTTHEVLKNFPTAGQMEKRLGRYGSEVRFTNYQYYWMATCRIMAA